MRIKTKDLAGEVLDWAVLKAMRPSEEVTIEDLRGRYDGIICVQEPFCPSSGKGQAGAIIESEGIATRRLRSGTWWAIMSTDLGDEHAPAWSEFTMKDVPRHASTSRRQRYEGSTQGVAAMRCFVGFRMGDEVEIPEGLL